MHICVCVSFVRIVLLSIKCFTCVGTVPEDYFYFLYR